MRVFTYVRGIGERLGDGDRLEGRTLSNALRGLAALSTGRRIRRVRDWSKENSESINPVRDLIDELFIGDSTSSSESCLPFGNFISDPSQLTNHLSNDAKRERKGLVTATDLSVFTVFVLAFGKKKEEKGLTSSSFACSASFRRASSICAITERSPSRR